MKDLPRAAQKDWLFMILDTSDKAKLPAEPLVPRRHPVGLRESVYLIGCEYRDVSCQQRVYSGRVTGRMGDNFRFELEQPVRIRGFSGAPILDGRGHLIGVMPVQFVPFTIGEDSLEAGGQDASLGLELLAAASTHPP